MAEEDERDHELIGEEAEWVCPSVFSNQFKRKVFLLLSLKGEIFVMPLRA